MDEEIRDMVIETRTMVRELHSTLSPVPQRLVKLESWSDAHTEEDDIRFKDLKQEVKKNRSWLYIVVGVGLIGLGSTLGFAESVKLFVGI